MNASGSSGEIPEVDDDDEPVCDIHRDEMKDIFALLDADGSGNIDPKEIRMQMKALGFEADNTTIYQLISDMDTDGSQNLEFEEFVKILKDMDIHSVRYATRDNMQEVFDFLDDLEPQRRDKKIDSSNLKRIAQVLGDQISDAEIDVMIEEADRGGKGYVTAEDFYVMMAAEARRMKEQKDVHPQPEDKLERRHSSKASQRWKKALISDKVDSVLGEWKQSSEKQAQAAEEKKFHKTRASLTVVTDADGRSSSKKKEAVSHTQARNRSGSRDVRNRSGSRDGGQKRRPSEDGGHKRRPSGQEARSASPANSRKST